MRADIAIAMLSVICLYIAMCIFHLLTSKSEGFLVFGTEMLHSSTYKLTYVSVN